MGRRPRPHGAGLLHTGAVPPDSQPCLGSPALSSEGCTTHRVRYRRRLGPPKSGAQLFGRLAPQRAEQCPAVHLNVQASLHLKNFISNLWKKLFSNHHSRIYLFLEESFQITNRHKFRTQRLTHNILQRNQKIPWPPASLRDTAPAVCEVSALSSSCLPSTAFSSDYCNEQENGFALTSSTSSAEKGTETPLEAENRKQSLLWPEEEVIPIKHVPAFRIKCSVIIIYKYQILWELATAVLFNVSPF